MSDFDSTRSLPEQRDQDYVHVYNDELAKEVYRPEGHQHRESFESLPVPKHTMARGEQTPTRSDHQDLTKALTSKFDVGDALKLNETQMGSSYTTGSRRRYDEESTVESGSLTPISTLQSSVAISASGRIPTASLHTRKTEDEVSTSLTNQEEPEEAHESGLILEKVFTNKSTGRLELPPDGGYGWISTFCVFLVMFSTWGCNSSFGIFLAFYLNHDTFPGATKYDYALIAGLTVFLGQGLAPFITLIMRVIGLKPTMLIGTFFLLAGFLMASFAKRLWELYLTQGVLIGVSIAFIFVPATTVIPGWFLKKRAVAMGISLIGTGAGGVTYSLASNQLINQYGDTAWALRMLAITCTISCLVAIFFIKAYNPPPTIGLSSASAIYKEFKVLFDLRIVKKPFIPLITAWFTFALFGYNLMIFTLSSYVVARGYSAHSGTTVTAILNGCQAIGRPLMGFAGDRYGRINVTITLTSLLTIFLFAFWIPAHTFVQLIFFAICLGLCVGVANVMNTVLIADMVPPSEFLPAWSFVNYGGAPALLVCEVIAQALTDKKNKSNPYLHTQIFSGLCFFVALLLIIALREYSIRLKFTDRRKVLQEKLLTLKESEENCGKESVSGNDNLIQEKETLNQEKFKYDDLLKPGFKAYVNRLKFFMKV